MAVGNQALPLPRPDGPRSAPATATTITLTAAELAAETAATVARAERVLPVVIAMVDRYAPAAPAVVKNEACIRFGGYLLQSDYGSHRKESEGPQDVEYITNHAPAFRNSGAAALLTVWKVRRAGSIG